MKNNKNKEQILSSIRNTVEKLEKSTEEYLSGFDANSAFSFLSNEDVRKKHLRTYNNFYVKLKTNFENCEEEVALLSSLIRETDNDCDKELTGALVKQFDLYLNFSSSVSHFIKNCETAFLDKDSKFRPLSIANYARELLVAIQNYKNSI